MSDVSIIKVKATNDKETKTTQRYVIVPNEKGISGSLYIKKDMYNLEDEIKIKIKID